MTSTESLPPRSCKGGRRRTPCSAADCNLMSFHGSLSKGPQLKLEGLSCFCLRCPQLFSHHVQWDIRIKVVVVRDGGPETVQKCLCRVENSPERSESKDQQTTSCRSAVHSLSRGLLLIMKVQRQANATNLICFKNWCYGQSMSMSRQNWLPVFLFTRLLPDSDCFSSLSEVKFQSGFICINVAQFYVSADLTAPQQRNLRTSEKKKKS